MEKPFIHWFTLQTPTTARDGPGQSQGLPSTGQQHPESSGCCHLLPRKASISRKLSPNQQLLWDEAAQAMTQPHINCLYY